VLALIYDLGPDYVERRAPWREAHLAAIRGAHERGELEQAGAFSDPYDRVLLTWLTEDEAVVRTFADADPYVVNGLVTGYSIRRWNVVIDDAAPR
jgi:hypothetical protein